MRRHRVVYIIDCDEKDRLLEEGTEWAQRFATPSSDEDEMYGDHRDWDY